MQFWKYRGLPATKLALVLIPFLATSCITSKSAYYGSFGEGLDSAGQRVFLSPEQEIPSDIQKFASTNYMDEFGKINYLLFRVRTSSYGFVRNGHAYAAEKGAMWLRWKMGNPYFKKHPVRSADAFVHTVANISLQSGLPYLIQFPDGSRHRLESILANELWVLERHLVTEQLIHSPVTHPSANPLSSPTTAASVPSSK